MTRGLNFNTTNTNLISTADLGGQKLLNMNGSLSNWINTGNAGVLDSYKKSAPINEKQKEKKKIDISKIVKFVVASLGVAAAGVLLYRNKAQISDYFKKINDELKNKLAKNEAKNEKRIKNIFKGAKKEAEDTLDIAKEKIEKPKKRFFTKKEKAADIDKSKNKASKNLKDKFKGLFKNKTDNPSKAEPKNLQKQNLSKPETHDELDEIKALCGYDKVKKTQYDDFERVFEDSKDIMDTPEGEVINTLRAKAIKKGIIEPPCETTPAFDDELAEIKALCGYDKVKKTHYDDFERVFEDSKDIMDTPEGEVVNTLRAKAIKKAQAIEEAKAKEEAKKAQELLKAKEKAQAIKKAQIEAEEKAKKAQELAKAKIEADNNELAEIKALCGYGSDSEISLDDFDKTFDKAKKALDTKPGEGLAVLGEKPKEVAKETMEDARNLAKELQEKYHSAIEAYDVKLPDEAFDFNNNELYTNTTYEFFDPTTGQRLGAPYQLEEDGTPIPLLDGKPKRKRIVIPNRNKAD